MLNRPRFRPHFHVEVVPGEGVLLLSDSRQTLLRGRLYEQVAPWLDGRTSEDLCHQLRGTASPAAIFYALAQLERKDYLCEEEGALPAGQAALWSSQQVAPAEAARRLADRPVVVRAFGVEANPVLELLQSLHVRVAGEGRAPPPAPGPGPLTAPKNSGTRSDTRSGRRRRRRRTRRTTMLPHPRAGPRPSAHRGGRG